MDFRKPTVDGDDDVDDEDGQVMQDQHRDSDLKLRPTDPDFVTLEETLGAGIDDADQGPPRPMRQPRTE